MVCVCVPMCVYINLEIKNGVMRVTENILRSVGKGERNTILK